MDAFVSKFRSTGRTHVGKVRACNEDAFVERTEVGLWAVSDGMGGHKAGDVASAMVVAALRQIVPVGDAVSTAAIRESMNAVNSGMYQQGKMRDGMMGATVVVLAADGEKISCLWAGDSRLYRFRKGELVQLTRDHRYIQALLDAGVLSAADALVHPRRHVITRAVGVDPQVNLDLVEGTFERGDVLMLASDGVTSTCSDADLATLLASTRDLDIVADGVVEACLSAGAPDNLTVVLVTRD